MTRRPVEQAEMFPTRSRHHRRGPNTRALGTTLAAMKATGMLERVDEAIIVGARDAASRLDAAGRDDDESRFVVARLSADYREWLTALARIGHGEGNADLDELLTALRDGA